MCKFWRRCNKFSTIFWSLIFHISLPRLGYFSYKKGNLKFSDWKVWWRKILIFDNSTSRHRDNWTTQHVDILNFTSRQLDILKSRWLGTLDLKKIHMASSGHNNGYIPSHICTNTLVFGKWTFFILFFLGIVTNPIISQIYFLWHNHFSDSFITFFLFWYNQLALTKFATCFFESYSDWSNNC